MSLRVLYLTKLLSALSTEAFAGRKLATALPGEDGFIMVRHWIADSRDDWIGHHPDITNDVGDRAEVDEFAPNVIYLEGGLYRNEQDWRIPLDLAVKFVTDGGTLIVADIAQQELMDHYQA
jgi:hypothetical protein